MSTVTIRGDRHTGKTHAALGAAALDALRGGTVVWFAHSWAYAATAQRDLVDLLPGPAVHKVHVVNGGNRVDLTSGGRVLFMSCRAAPTTTFTGPGLTFVFDGAPVPEGFEQDNPDARIYVTELTPPDAEVFVLAERMFAAVHEFAAAIR